eukprot:TRINITY_DN62370_c0_g1_i1.p1 TRINITY_DN62370_c0_g1~~TRINITY_DN62370_c0_g1_i1.p1  ORF type:complete len:247 (+),score=40.71 TRINITY_DN62370_c0_g1_i1:167-907(+)
MPRGLSHFAVNAVWIGDSNGCHVKPSPSCSITAQTATFFPEWGLSFASEGRRRAAKHCASAFFDLDTLEHDADYGPASDGIEPVPPPPPPRPFPFFEPVSRGTRADIDGASAVNSGRDGDAGDEVNAATARDGWVANRRISSSDPDGYDQGGPTTVEEEAVDAVAHGIAMPSASVATAGRQKSHRKHDHKQRVDEVLVAAFIVPVISFVGGAAFWLFCTPDPQQKSRMLQQDDSDNNSRNGRRRGR